MIWTGKTAIHMALFLGIVVGVVSCTTTASPRPTAVHLCPSPRPALVDAQERLTEEGLRWIGACLEAGRLNCVEVAAIRREDPAQCDEAVR